MSKAERKPSVSYAEAQMRSSYEETPEGRPARRIAEEKMPEMCIIDRIQIHGKSLLGPYLHTYQLLYPCAGQTVKQILEKQPQIHQTAGFLSIPGRGRGGGGGKERRRGPLGSFRRDSCGFLRRGGMGAGCLTDAVACGGGKEEDGSALGASFSAGNGQRPFGKRLCRWGGKKNRAARRGRAAQPSPFLAAGETDGGRLTDGFAAGAGGNAAALTAPVPAA